LADHVHQAHDLAPVSDQVKKEEEEEYLPMEVEYTVPEMKQPEQPGRLIAMGQGAFKPYTPVSSAAPSIPISDKASESVPVPVKRKALSQSSLLQFFH